MAQPHRPNEIRLIRIFEAPPETIWAAWTDPAQVGQWSEGIKAAGVKPE